MLSMSIMSGETKDWLCVPMKHVPCDVSIRWHFAGLVPAAPNFALLDVSMTSAVLLQRAIHSESE